ncbi:hypothetical protein BLBBGE_374 [Blattabacterium sp. (Blattella germanica) str. Bge]|nr:hypothetical protein BLBBGE_374 [Blattabacterium sp. (Blattella germanica) str. Bge]
MFIFIRNFLHKKWCILKNEVIQVLISIMTEIFFNFFLLIFCIIIFFLGSLSLCFFLSFYFGNYVIGFGFLTILYFFLFLFIFFFCRNISRFFIKNLLSKSIFRIFDKKN